MTLEIISPEGLLFKGEVSEVAFPGTSGAFEILQDHAPFISSLKAGVIRFKAGGEQKEQAIKGGLVEVKENHLSVCVESSK